MWSYYNMNIALKIYQQMSFIIHFYGIISICVNVHFTFFQPTKVFIADIFTAITILSSVIGQ